jgi:hypothetical protein
MERWLEESMAAFYLNMETRQLRQLREDGGGPRCYTLPDGDFRYNTGDLDNWVMYAAGDMLRIEDNTNVVAFPGVKLRRRRRKLKSRLIPGKRGPGRPRKEDYL